MAEDTLPPTILPPTQGFGTPAPEQRLGDMAETPIIRGASQDFGIDYSESPNKPEPMGVWSAASRFDYTPGAIWTQKDAGNTFDDDGTDPFEENKPFPQYASRPDRFVDVFNKQALQARRAQLDMEDEVRAVQERHPIKYALAATALQFVDPINWLPMMTVAKVGKGAYTLGRAGMGVGTLGAFGAVGASAAAATAAQEAILQSVQQTRTLEESAQAVGGSFVLGGLLGVGAANLAKAFSKPATRSALATIDAMVATNGNAGVASVAGPAMADIVSRVRAGERVSTHEIEAATKTAMFEARQGRDISDAEVLARVQYIDQLATAIQRTASVAQASELENVVRYSFGSEGSRLVDGGAIKVVQSVEDLPARPDGVAHFEDTRGVFDGERAYIVADNVAPDEVRGVVLHEIGVHYGMQRMLGDANFRALLEDVVNRANANEARFAEAKAAVPKETPAQHVAEEVLAYLVENAPETGIVQRVIAAVKQFVRQAFGGKFTGLSEAEIRQLAVAALRKWNKEARPAEVRQPRGSLRTEDEAALRDVVRYSRGKDATYAPLDRLVDSNRIPWISLKDIRGRTVFPTIADRTAAGALYKGIDGSELNLAIHLPGGPNYPFRENNMEAGVVWANKGKGVSATKAERAKQGQLMAVMLGDANMHQSNSTVSKAFFQTIDAYVRDGRIPAKNIDKIDTYVRETFENFPGIKNAEAFDKWVDNLSFEDRKRLIKIMGGKKVQGLGGPSLDRVLDATRDPEYAGNRWGDAVVIVEPDPSQPLVKLGTQGTTEHPDYPTGIRGKVIGKLRTPINYEALYADFLSEARDAAVARGTKESKINPRRAFELKKPAIEITDDLIKRLEPIEQTAIRNAREAKLTAAFGADRWKTSGIDKNKGGISPQEFVDAIAQSPASATLTKYTTSEVNKAVKAGNMRVFQLGEDGRVWFALKKGDPASGYDLDPKKFGFVDKEVTLTSVVNNEQGVRGIPGEAVMLKAIQEGATALDAFAVSSEKFPNGFLPSYYAKFGFREVGRTKFDPQYYTANQLADLKKFWKETGWKESDGYPDVAFMKWDGTDADRQSFARRYLDGGVASVSTGGNRADVEGAAANPPASVRRASGRGTEAVAGSDRGLAGNAGGSGASRLRDTLDELKGLSDTALRNFGLTRSDIDALKYSRANREAARTAPTPIADALNNGEASVVGRGGAIFYSRAGEKREKVGHIIAYHGSPHDFDRFSMEKIGTGEGAQAYGHGLYFAEEEKVARNYRNALSTRNLDTGDAIDWENPAHVAAAWTKIYHNNPQYALEYLLSVPEQYQTAVVKEAQKLLETGAPLPGISKGHMYEVRINADPEHFIDWDKSLAEQPKAVRDALISAGDAADHWTGKQLAEDLRSGADGTFSSAYNSLKRSYGGDAGATEALKKAGAPGIKYLDGQSRTVTGQQAIGDGTRNYVVFDDSLIEIVRKYSRGGNRKAQIADQLEALYKALDNIDNPDAFASTMAALSARSAGAEAVAQVSREDLRTYGKLPTKVQDATWFMNPILRLRTSPVATAARIGQQVWEDVIKSNMHMQGRTLGPQVETLIRQQLASVLGQAAQKYDAIYQEARKAGLRMTKTQFSESISSAMRRGDQHEVPAVVKAAKMWRETVFDPLKKMAQETRITGGGYLLDPDIETKFAESYLHRMANHKKITADEFGFKRAVADWMEGAMRNEYTRDAANARQRLAAFDQDEIDLQLNPEQRLAELEGLEKAYEDLDVRYAREANIRREYNALRSKSAELRKKGDRGAAKTALEEARNVAKQGGDRYNEYLGNLRTLNRRMDNVDFGFAGMSARQDAIQERLASLNDTNIRALNRLVARGQKLERELARLDPQLRSEKLAELRDQIDVVLERQNKAAERLFNQVEAADKARLKDEIKLRMEKRRGGMSEALAGNTEAKQKAAEAEREAALDEAIRKYVAAEKKRGDQLNAIKARMDRLDNLDLDGQAAELRAAVDSLVAQQSDLTLARGEKSQRLKDKLARVDQSVVEKRLEEVRKAKQELTRKFYERWETKLGGEGVDLNATVAQPRFSEWAKTYADQAFNLYSGRSPDAGKVPDFAVALRNGPLAERTLPVPDTVLEPWLENDIGTIAARYARSMLGQIEVTRKFGRPGMDDQFLELQDAYLKLREQINAAPNSKEMLAIIDRQPSLKDAFEAWRRGSSETTITKERLLDWLKKREESDKTDIEAARDLMLGRYANEENMSDLGKLSRVLVMFNTITKMGGYVIGSLTDVYRPAMIHGLKNYLAHGVAPALTNLEGFRAAKSELAKEGIGVEYWLRGYTTMNAGILDPYAPGSQAERLMEKLSRVGAKLSGMTLFNDLTRQMGGMSSMNKILESAMKKTDRDYLAVLGIDPGMAQRIADQFRVHGRDIKGMLVAETDKWADAEAVRVFRAAVNKDVSTIFVEKSAGDVPLFVNRPLGRIITQFRSFALASNQRVLMRGLQDGNSAFVGHLVGMTIVGMLVAYLRSLRGGEDRYEKFMKSAENPGFWIGEGLDNSGIFSLLFEGANTFEKLSQSAGANINPIKQPLRMMFPDATQQGESTRFIRRSPLESVLGPSAGIPQEIGRALNTQGTWEDRAKAAQRLTPFLGTHPGFSDMIKVLSGESAFY